MTSLETPPGIDLPQIPVTGNEVDLVEELILHRAMYARYLRVLATYYTERGFREKSVWAMNELNDLQRVKPYAYLNDTIVPASTMSPAASIAEADRLYQEGLDLMEKGGHGVPAIYDREIMKQALVKLKKLVNEYPDSDKIDDAAFFIAEVHKEYFGEDDNSIAIEWYKKSIEWNPELPHPARFQLAVVYDHRLHEREEALKWYQEVIDKEDGIDKSNTMYSSNRISYLTRERTRHMAAETSDPDAGRPQPIVSPEPAAGTSAEASPRPTNVPR